MKTNVSIDLSDEQRNTLARLLTPNTPKRLATRKEVNALVHDFVEAYLDQSPLQASQDRVAVAKRADALGKRPRIEELIELERPNWPGKSDSWLRGACKVKYAKQLRR